ncbi:MAG: DUF4422 domain-containing protein [Butyrivibrio sp.]|jgi:hypothetical protein|nr:DUF4422 domain-containing protein [Butyrivibrio sp.]
MDEKKAAIFGAQGIALGTYEALTAVNPEMHIECFVVTKYGNNAKLLGGIPVYELDEFVQKYSDGNSMAEIKVLIATPESVMDEIEKSLVDKGVSNFERMNSVKYSELWKKYQSEKGDYLPVSSYLIEDDSKSVETKIFMARFHKDKPLQGVIEAHEYLNEIQVGAAYTSESVRSLWHNLDIIKDNSGDNISEKNCNYSEMTALYWIWKHVLCDPRNDEHNYYGLCHYRRQLDLLPEEIEELRMRDIDVVLPFPLPYEPDINAHHERYLSDTDWKAVLQALKEVSPEYRAAVDEVFSQRYLYNYNLILARKDVLREYCEWLFPILTRVEELSVPKGSERSDRYIGYVAENLETLYFMKNRNRLKIGHTGCIFRV